MRFDHRMKNETDFFLRTRISRMIRILFEFFPCCPCPQKVIPNSGLENYSIYLNTRRINHV